MHLFKKTRINNPRQKTSFHFLPFLRQKRQKSAKNRTKINKPYQKTSDIIPINIFTIINHSTLKRHRYINLYINLGSSYPFFAMFLAVLGGILAVFCAFYAYFILILLFFSCFWPSYWYFWLKAPYYHQYPTLLDITACSVHQKTVI